MQTISNSKQYNYIISNYDKYNLNLQSQYDMLTLLNKLEAHDETLDSLHECDYNGFCNIVFTDNNEGLTDKRIANAVAECNSFFESKEQYLQWTEEENIEDLQYLSEMWDDSIASGNIVKTTDGYVELCIV